MLDVMVLSLTLTGPAAAVMQATPPARAGVRLDQEEVEEFLEEVNEYIEHRTRAREDLPKLDEESDPEEVTAYAKALTAKIAARRRGAKQGDVFNPKLARSFKRIFAAELARGDHERKVVLTEGNPTGDEEKIAAPRVAVNAQYIPASPLSTVPPTLLLLLPTLPEEVEYRFIGRSLILRDSVANLIIDFIPNAVP